MNRKIIVAKIEDYYTQKLKQHGPVPQGVDWNGAASQNLRFDQLTKIIAPESKPVSLLDFGCGYGALLTYLNNKKLNINYAGFDISKEMINAATNIHSATNSTWTSDENDLSQYDYVIASGVFNIMEQTPSTEWEQYVIDTLSQIDKRAKKGFSFNLLTNYSDIEKMRKNLYYASPSKYFDHCKTVYSKSVALLHDYQLYEFTILVRKNIL
jgi:SAM-dependent methyltransferase